MLIWWLFESNYLMIIWWLFDKWLFGDYSMIIWIWLFLIIRWLFDPNYSWLFDDYLTLIILDYSMIIWSKLFVIIWWLFDFWASSRLVGLLHSQKHSHGTAWWWQPFACANHSLRFSPATCCRSYGSTGTTLLSFMTTSTRRALCPAPPAVFFCERYWTQPSRNIWRYPAPSSRISSAMESRFFSHVLSGVTPRTYNNQNNHNHCNNHNINNLAHHLLSVLCAFEAQVPENVIHKMQHLLVEEIKIFYFFRIILVLAPGKDCITAGRQVMANSSTMQHITYTSTPAFKSSSTSSSSLGCQIGIPKIEAR